MTRPEALACLYVLRWAAYRRSPHVQSPSDREHEYKRLRERLGQVERDGHNPIPPDQEEPDHCHVLRQAIGAFDLDPSGQEAYLTVELAGRVIEFVHWRFLAGYARNPWSWWQSEAPNGQESSKAQCRALLDLLSSEIGKKPENSDISATAVV